MIGLIYKGNSVLVFLLFGYIHSFCIESDSTILNNSQSNKTKNSDTIFYSEVPSVFINAPHENVDMNELLRYQRLIRNVKKAYPYAIIARDKLKELNENLSKISSKKQQKLYVDSVEHQMMVQYEEELKNLTVTQGRILIKLIDREIGNTSYDLVKEYRGSFSAFFWQTLARLFGSSLKTKYYPNGEDKDIEEIILKIQTGQI